ncbi:HERC1, partial [Symbiodinium pilosum]
MEPLIEPRHLAEWPGAVSSRFTDKFTGLPLCRKKVDANNAAGEPTGLARQGFSQFFADTEGLKICQGRKYIPVSTGENYQWRPSKRQLSEPGLHNIEKNEGKLRVQPPPTQVFSIPERRHVRMVESKEEYGDLAVGKGIVHRAPGLRAAEVAAREVDVTVEMQRKARNQELDLKHNGI